MKKYCLLMALAAGILLLVTPNAHATFIMAGVPDSGLISRGLVDGAGGIDFIELSSPINSNGLITSWSIYAQNTGGPWGVNTSPLGVQLVIFQSIGGNYTVVGESPMETISTWNQKYTFDLVSGIQVKSGDYLGWYYPPQGILNSVNGGVIAYDSTSGNTVQFTTAWGSAPELSVGDVLLASTLTEQTRLYSINVSGVPLPPTVLLLGSGLMGLGLLRFRRKA
jgi:hypothetical protein